tara:strand:+ start:629 stop:844 length:216 start_codon:yes stop_codon:yes gene_type:complete
MANIKTSVDGVIREMTDAEQAEYDARQKQNAEQEKLEKEEQTKKLENQASAKKKLKDLGLTDDEISALIGA